MTNPNDTNVELAQDAAFQLTYILSALGITDTYAGTHALRIALGGARKADLRTVVETLRKVKSEVREIVKAERLPNEGGN